MANDDVVSETVVWGCTVPLGSDGKRMWPAAVKQIALLKLAEGATARNAAAEIGITDAMIYGQDPLFIRSQHDSGSARRLIYEQPFLAYGSADGSS